MMNPTFDFERSVSTASIDDPLTESDSSIQKKYFNELVITKNQPISIPHLSEEVRAFADAEKFAKKSYLLLNNEHIRTEEVVKALLRQMNILEEEKIKKALKTLLISNTDEEGDYLQFSKTINGFEHNVDGTMAPDPSWLVIMASLSWINKRIVGITTTVHPINMGASHSSVKMLAIVLTPVKDKHSKSDIQTSRTIAAILSDPIFRQSIHGKEVTEDRFRSIFQDVTQKFHKLPKMSVSIEEKLDSGLDGKLCFGIGIYKDLKRRLPFYASDYADSFIDKNSIIKTFITILVLFFANLLPTIAFGMLNESTTKQKINVTAGIMAQAIGGVIYALIGGQPLIVMLTTSPLSIMIMAIYETSSFWGFDFFQFYKWIGIFNAIYLLIFALSGASRIMKYSRRSTEETFALFVSVTFIVDAIKACVKSFNYYYHGEKCLNATDVQPTTCLKEESLLFLFLLLSTMVLSLWLYRFTKTPFLNIHCRKLLVEFAFPLSILFMSLVGSFVFKEVKVHSFNAQSWRNITFSTDFVSSLPVSGFFMAAAMALPLSILFFMEQNIASSIINSPLNKLKKGTAYHWDLLVVGIINLVLSILGLPWVHGALPHSPMHLTSLASIEEHIDEGNHITKKVLKVVETRLPSIIANIIIGCCIFLMPYPLLYIPAPVLYGLFLFLAFTTMAHNQLYERLLLFITEQSAYPPNHYLKRVPQRKVHMFTVIQTVQFLLLCAAGLTPIIIFKMVFPLILLLLIPFRCFIFPKIIDKKFLDALDKAI